MAIRTLHGITWTDDLAWMENKGDNEGKQDSRWKFFLTQEQKRWSTVINTSPVRDQIPLLKAQLAAAKEVMLAPMFLAAGGEILIRIEGFTIEWKWKKSKEERKVSALDVQRGGWTWSIEDVGKGSETNELRCSLKDVKGEEVVWSARGVGPYVHVIGDRVYALEAKKQLIYYRLVSWKAHTGTDYKIHYEEKDFRYNLELIGAGAEGGFLRRQAGEKQDAFAIGKDGRLTVLEGGVSDSSRKWVFGSGTGEYLVWTSERSWRLSPILRHHRWKLPPFHRAVPEILDTKKRILVTKWYGVRTIWVLSKTENARTVWRGFGTIMPDPWEGPWVRIAKAGCQTIWWNSLGSSRPQDTLSWCSQTDGHFAISKDGTRVPFVLIRPTLEEKPRGLLVIGYGAYGLSLPLGTARWTPLLQAGWALCLGLWRGGGDHTPEWEDVARVKGRGLVLEDAEAVVREAQKLADVPAERTVLFGRSAGGLWAGGLSARFPNGELAGGAYMEVPYLDVLRTITNRDLPLTDIETDEFGLPEYRLSDFRQTLRWSPMETLPAEGTPGMWQIVRTGLNDSQVFPYESAKWIVRSRGGEATRPILLAIEGGQGHFVTGATAVEQEAEDLAVLLFFTDRWASAKYRS